MNKILLTILIAGFGAQIIKLIIYLIKHKSLHLRDLIVTGGMPSSHSAFVVSLTTIIYLMEGVSSTFVISLVLAIIVLRDAFGVRRTVGEEGRILTKMMKKMKIKTKTHFSFGHTPLQVLVGALLGFITAFLMFYLF